MIRTSTYCDCCNALLVDGSKTPRFDFEGETPLERTMYRVSRLLPGGPGRRGPLYERHRDVVVCHTCLRHSSFDDWLDGETVREEEARKAYEEKLEAESRIRFEDIVHNLSGRRIG